MSLATRLNGSNPGAQVSQFATGSIATPSAKLPLQRTLGAWSYTNKSGDIRGFIANPTGTIGVVYAYNGTSTATFYYSTDGITWNNTTCPNGCLGMAWDTTNNRFIALSYAGNIYMYSSDGINWTSGSASISSNFSSIAHGLGYNVVVDRNGYLWYGTSLNSWTQVTTYGAASDQRVTFGNGRFNVIKNSAGGSSTIYTSTNGTSWSSYTAPSAPYYLSYANNMWFMNIASGTAYYTSTDGLNWTYRNTLPASKVWGGVNFVNGIYYTFDIAGATSAYSLDGITWKTLAWTPATSYGPQANSMVGGVNGYAVIADDTTEIYYAKVTV